MIRKRVLLCALILIFTILFVSCGAIERKNEDHSLDGTYTIDHIYSISYKTDISPSSVNADGSKMGVNGRKFDLKLNYSNGTIAVSGTFTLGSDGESLLFYDNDGKVFGAGTLIKGNVYTDIYILIGEMDSFMYCFEKQDNSKGLDLVRVIIGSIYDVLLCMKDDRFVDQYNKFGYLLYYAK